MTLDTFLNRVYSAGHKPVYILLLAVILVYGNSVFNAYCFDDSIVILLNQYVSKGFFGIGDILTHGMFAGSYKILPTDVFRYRPLSITTYAIERGLWGAYPQISHLINIVLFAILTLKLHDLLAYVSEESQNTILKGSHFALIGTLLFVVLPVHAEVVANIKGREDIMSLLFILLSCLSALKYASSNGRNYLWLTGVWTLLALLSKESSVTLMIVIPAILFVYGKGSKRTNIYTLGSILAASVIYFGLLINAKLNNKFAEEVHFSSILVNSFQDATFAQYVGTQFLVYWKYLQLLLFPINLTVDYYPYHIQYVTLSVESVVGFICFGLSLWSIWYYFKRNWLIFLAILVYLGPLVPVSNIFFPVGVFMSERFLFIPSVGYCIILSYIFCWLIERYRKCSKIILLGIASILLLYGVRTVVRNSNWKNDYTLFSHDIKVSGNSIKCNHMLAKTILETIDTISDETRKQKMCNDALRYINRSLYLYPENAEVATFKGGIYAIKDTSVDLIVYWTFRALEISPGYETSYQSLFQLIRDQSSMVKKIWIAEKMRQIRPNDYEVNNLLGVLYGKVHEESKGEYYLKQAISIQPQRKEAYLNLGIVYIRLKDYPMAAKALEQTLAIDPWNVHALRNLAFAYEQIGETQKAQACYLSLQQIGY